MKRSSVLFVVSILVLLIVAFLLIQGSDILLTPLSRNSHIPLGTFIAWAGIISVPLTVYSAIKNLRKPQTSWHRILSKVLRITLILSLLWVPVCYLLAGNLSFTFSEKETFQGGQLAMKWFWSFSYALPIASLSVLLLYWISLLQKKL